MAASKYHHQRSIASTFLQSFIFLCLQAHNQPEDDANNNRNSQQQHAGHQQEQQQQQQQQQQEQQQQQQQQNVFVNFVINQTMTNGGRPPGRNS